MKEYTEVTLYKELELDHGDDIFFDPKGVAAYHREEFRKYADGEEFDRTAVSKYAMTQAAMWAHIYEEVAGKGERVRYLMTAEKLS